MVQIVYTGHIVQLGDRVAGIDISPDRRGDHIAVDAADIIEYVPDYASRMTEIFIREGALVVVGGAAAAEHTRIRAIVHNRGPNGQELNSRDAAIAAWAEC